MPRESGASSNDGLAITGSPAFAGDEPRTEAAEGVWRNEPEETAESVLAERTRDHQRRSRGPKAAAPPSHRRQSCGWFDFNHCGRKTESSVANQGARLECAMLHFCSASDLRPA